MQGQTITHSLIELEREYVPFWSSNTSLIRFDFGQNYTLGKKDTSYQLFISVSEKKVEVESVSLGAALFSYASGGSVVGLNTTHKVDERQGVAILDYKQFMEIYDCISQVFTFITTLEIKTGKQHNTIATCAAGDLTIGVEYLPKKQYQTAASYNFYFKVGDATFSLKRREFEELAKTIRDIKVLWNQKLSIKS